MFRRSVPAFAFAAWLFLGLAANVTQAQGFGLADRIEEDWVLVVDGTASDQGPQVNTVMSPTADLSQAAVSLGINYCQTPAFAAGGLQVLVFNQNGLASSSTLATNPINASETVKWTQRMRISDGNVQFSIPSMTSTAWGTVASDSPLASFSISDDTFTSYSPATSVASSGGAWKTNGLTSLTLSQVRYYSGKTLILTDTTARPVDCTKPFSKP
jgi:hypothetical protein